MHILNYTDLGHIDISNSEMTSPYLDYIFYLTSSTNNLLSKGTYFNLQNIIFIINCIPFKY